jgi:HNH endonuclease
MSKLDWFWYFVKITDEEHCWEWIGSRNEKGYGLFWGKSGVLLAHREAYRREKGEPGEFVVCHKCDNPPCVSPYHLFLGTVQDNNLDKKLKGRDAKGEGHGRAKLTKDQVAEIRSKYKPYEYSMQKLADEYGVDKATIKWIIQRKTWNS